MADTKKLGELEPEDIMERIDALLSESTTADAIASVLAMHVLATNRAADYSPELTNLLVGLGEGIRHVIARLDVEAWRDGFALFQEETDA